MDVKCSDSHYINDRLQNILSSLSKCKIEFLNEKEENLKLKEINTKLELELKESRELEKSHRYHLMSSRDMIGNLQETVSQLVYLKRDIKKLKDEITAKDSTITSLTKDKDSIMTKQKENEIELQQSFNKQIEELISCNDRKIQIIQHDSDTQIAQFTCVIEELRSKIKDLESEHKDKMNVVVLEYEEKLQRSSAQLAQMQEQLARQTARTDANIDAYRRRLEELEEKLKQNEFKQYLAQSKYPSQCESQVERPYSVNRDVYEDLNPVYESNSKLFVINKTPKPNTLQVTYSGNKNATCTKNSDTKKGAFNITKKRKLYNEKDYQDY